MVRLVLLEEDVDPPDKARVTTTSSVLEASTDWQHDVNDDRPNPNLNQFSAALSCYPIVSQLAGYIDLNTLHELSRTCRQIRANLLQYRTQLIAQTLRCENEHSTPAQRLGNAFQASHAIWTTYGRDGVKVGRITSGKVGACARDMVGECRRCGNVVCRNCIVKTPQAATLKCRHRRLCRVCIKSPIELLTTIPAVPIFESLDQSSTSPGSGNSGSNGNNNNNNNSNTCEPLLLARSPCTCTSSGVWLCHHCGVGSRSADTTYLRGWTWRTRYSACGGMGAGLGEGNEGVECGRTRECLGARIVEKDVECDAAELAELDAAAVGRCWEGGSYATQEIMGIGGKVKRKVRKLVPVGAIVKEYEDERIAELFLEREQKGINRSWCSWCERVVLGKKDAEATTGSRESVGSSSSIGSGT